MKRTVRAVSPPDREYYLEKIVSHRDGSAEREFEVKWKGYPSSKNKWVSGGVFGHDQPILDAYIKKHKLTEWKKPVDDKNMVEHDEDEDEWDEEDEDAGIYEIESIVSHREENDSIVYTVAWKGYPGEDSEATEEDLEGAPVLLTAYKKKNGLPLNEEKKDDGPSSGLRTRSSDRKKPESSSSRTRAAKRRVAVSNRPTARMSTGDPPPKKVTAAALPTRPSPRKRPAVSRSSSRSPILDITPRRRQRDLPARRSLGDRDGGDASASASPQPTPVKKYGFHMGLDVDSIIKSEPDVTGTFLAKVCYKDPIPDGMKKREEVPAKMLRTVCPGLLFDYYEAQLIQKD